VAVCGGSGGELWREALAAGAQLFLTGEIGYHQGLEAAEAGLTVAAYGHRESELPFVNHLASLLREAFPQLEVREL
jgi:putative NIF3 family GTP cyclohydrolase 1 type 2